jgi:hypothetical protein
VLIIELYIVYCSIVLVNGIAADDTARGIHHSNLSFRCDNDVVLNEMHSCDFLAIHIEGEELFLFFDTEAEDVALNVSECHDVFFFVDCDGCDLVVVVVEVLLVVQHVSHIPEHLDGAVPGGRNDGLALGHVEDVDDGVVVGGEGLRLAAVHDVEDVNVVVPGSDLNEGRVTAKTSSDLSITIELRLNSQILKDFVQLLSITSNIFKKPS